MAHFARFADPELGLRPPRLGDGALHDAHPPDALRRQAQDLHVRLPPLKLKLYRQLANPLGTADSSPRTPLSRRSSTG